MRRLIGGLLIVAWILTLASTAQAQSGYVSQQEREVSYSGAGGITLAGTLLIPRHQQGKLVPGAIIVVGSGLVDRNGNAGADLTSNLYHQIADQLASAGIASLRYDKRGVGASEPPPIDDSLPMTDQVALVAFSAWDNYVGDAAATLDYLQRQPEIDPARTAMIGHSEGGYLVLQAAVAGKDFHYAPAALVLLATPSRPYDEMIHDQLVAQMQARGASTSQVAALLRQNQAIVDTIKAKATIPDNVPDSLTSIYPPYLGEFYQGGFKANPRQLAAQFPGPVLVMQGALDSEVSATIDAPALDAALASRPHDDHKTVIVANASHSLKLVASASDPGYTGDLASQAAEELRSWLDDKLASSPSASSSDIPSTTTATPATTATTMLAETPAPSVYPITPTSPVPTVLPIATPTEAINPPPNSNNTLLILALIIVLLLIGAVGWRLVKRRQG